MAAMSSSSSCRLVGGGGVLLAPASLAAAGTALLSAALVAGAGVGRLIGADASILTVNSSGPTFSRSSLFSSTSPVTCLSLTNVPFVLPKSRRNALPSRCNTAQWRLLIIGLAGRR